MNRRSFLSTLLKAAVGFNILPGAGRIWKAESRIVPFWMQETRVARCVSEEYEAIMRMYRDMECIMDFPVPKSFQPSPIKVNLASNSYDLLT